jgi:hypothetical protein
MAAERQVQRIRFGIIRIEELIIIFSVMLFYERSYDKKLDDLMYIIQVN